MPADINTVSFFHLSTDFPVDKVVFLESGQFTVPASSSGYIYSIPHGLPFIPLMGGGWSLNSDFSTQYNYSSGTTPSTVPGALFAQQVNIFADATNVYFHANNTAGTSKVIYFRVMAFQPSNDDSDVPHTVSSGDLFNFDTSNISFKLVGEGYVDCPAAGGTASQVNVPDVLINSTARISGWVEAVTWNGTTNVTAVHPAGTWVAPANEVVIFQSNADYFTIETSAGGAAHRVHYREYV